jgi:hypothetical protein
MKPTLKDASARDLLADVRRRSKSNLADKRSTVARRIVRSSDHATQALSRFLEHGKQDPTPEWIRIDGFPRETLWEARPARSVGTCESESAEEMTNSDDLARVALEAFAAESVRSGTLSAFQARQLLGIQARYEMDGLLKRHGVFFDLRRRSEGV